MTLPSSRRLTLLLVLLSAVGLAAQLLIPCPGGSILWNGLFDAGHVVVYGLVALAALGLIRARSRRPIHRPLAPHAIALAITAGLGAVTEGVQALGLGDASLGDLGRDILGGVAFLLASIAVGREGALSGPRRTGPRRGTHRRAAAIGALLALTLALAPLAGTVLAYLQRNADFPALCSFDRRWERTFVRAGDDARLEIETPPSGWTRGKSRNEARDEPRSNRAARLTFLRAEYPGLVMNELYPDWRGYERLVFEAYSELDSTVTLELRINDARHDNAWADRFNRVLAIRPGANRIEIALAEVERAPRGRTMETDQMRTLVLFAHRPARTFALWLDEFRLE